MIYLFVKKNRWFACLNNKKVDSLIKKYDSENKVTITFVLAPSTKEASEEGKACKESLIFTLNWLG